MTTNKTKAQPPKAEGAPAEKGAQESQWEDVRRECKRDRLNKVNFIRAALGLSKLEFEQFCNMTADDLRARTADDLRAMMTEQ